MQDPWKYLAFPVSAVVAYLLALGVSSDFAAFANIPEFSAEIIVVAVSGLIAGFFVDEVIPAYVEKVRERHGRGGSGSDFGGDLDDMDFQ